MIGLVDMEHEQAAHRDPRVRACHQAYMRDIQRRLQEVSQNQCVVRRYRDVTPDWLETKEIAALVLSGNVTEWDIYRETDLQPLAEIVRSASLPILGLCGGLQFIALTHGAEVGPMRKLEDGEEGADLGFGSGYFKEWGFTPVQPIGSDPLFHKLDAPVFLEAHYWEVKEIPDGFELLASTEACRVQALRRSGTLIYGTQFHPEAYVAKPADRSNWLINLVYPDGYTQEQPDGRQLLTNFFYAVREHNRKASGDLTA